MEGTLLKRIGRPLGMSVWVSRQVRVTETAVEVESSDKVSKTYSLADVHVAVVHLGAVAKGKYAFALVGNEDDEMRVTLAAESKFDHRRWVDAIEQAQANQKKRPSRRRRTAVFSPPPSAIERKRRPLSESNRPTRSHMSFELVFRHRPLGLDLGSGARREAATVLGISADCELRDQLRLGDEIVGVNSTLFVADPDEIETGGKSSLARDDVKRLVEESPLPCTLVFRRPFVPAKSPPRPPRPPPVPEDQVVAPVAPPVAPPPPPTSESVQRFLRMTKAGVPIEAVTFKAELELEPAELQEFRAALNIAQGTTAAAAAPPPAQRDDPELAKYLKMKKLGAPAEQIVVKAEQNGASDATLRALRSKFGIAEVPKTPLKKPAPGGQQYKGIHWKGIRDEDSTTKKRGSLWGRTKRRESLGFKAETMINENKEALELVDNLFTAKKAPKKAATARPVSTPIDSGRSKDKVVELLDRQKALNLQIAMRGVVKNDVARGLRDIVATPSSDAVFDVDSLRSLRTALPTAEEIQRAALFAKRYPENTKFTTATLLAAAAHDDWGGGQPLLDIFDARLTLLEFEHDATAAIAAASSAADLCAELKASPELRAAIHAALALGNRLNHGTNRSHAKAVFLADLERLEHTKANDGTSAIDALATLLDLDKKNRGEDGLDAEQIDVALRRLKEKLDANKANAQQDRTFDVSVKLKHRKKRVEILLSQQRTESFVLSSDARTAFEAFQQDCEANLGRIDAAIAALDLELEDLDAKQNKLMDYVSEHESTIPSILDALDNFANSLIQARTRQAKKWWWQK